MFFATVEDSFQITGRGCVIVSSQPRSPELRLRAKDRIHLRYPDGRIIETYIAAIEMLCGPKVKDGMAFLLPEPITKSDVPSGTEIWLATNSN
jgi:hypothetical protein